MPVSCVRFSHSSKLGHVLFLTKRTPKNKFLLTVISFVFWVHTELGFYFETRTYFAEVWRWNKKRTGPWILDCPFMDFSANRVRALIWRVIICCSVLLFLRTNVETTPFSSSVLGAWTVYIKLYEIWIKSWENGREKMFGSLGLPYICTGRIPRKQLVCPSWNLLFVFCKGCTIRSSQDMSYSWQTGLCSHVSVHLRSHFIHWNNH